MAKKKLTKLEQMGIIALIAVIACFFYVKEVYEPECKKFKALKENWTKLSKEVKELKWKQGSKDIFSSIQEKEEELAEAKSKLKKASAILADKEDLSKVMTIISQLARQHNLKIQEFSPVEGNNPQDAKEVFLNRDFHKLIIVGEFLDLKEFLKGLNFLPKLVTVDKVLIEREGKKSNLKITMLLSI
ncbi:MAG: type 4a pilus biogenesis protein PilO [Candidatus Omnitrophica bacterium]|nr:type 4a pilus biogenesis protein PilO [Candidatus Omnitrophota bacterium]